MLLIFSKEVKLEKAAKNIRRLAQEYLDPDFEQPIEFWTQRWQARLLTNFCYLMVLNFYGNRSFEDPSQYPILPWPIASYKTDKELRSLQKRDFRKPVGC